MSKYVSPQSREKKKKQNTAKKLAVWRGLAAFVLVAAFGIVKVIEHFSPGSSKPGLLDDAVQQPNTDVIKQYESYADFIGPVQQTINLEVVSPEISMIQVAENGRVDMSYFNDAVFVGDSLADGFRVYASSMGLSETTALYLTAKSLSPLSYTQGGYISIVGVSEPIHALTALEQRNPGKVYITLGTNALMAMTPEEFIDSYYVLIDEIQTRCPNAIIYVTTITPVAAYKSREEPRLSHDRIYQANQLIAKMCNEKGLALINLYDVLKSDSGYLREDIAYSDGIHLTPSGYKEWLDYLISHTVYNPNSPYIPGSPYAF